MNIYIYLHNLIPPMPTKINIGLVSTQSDEFYRYKRDIIDIKITSKNEGQTHLQNLDIICQQLHTEQDDLVKYLQKSLSTPITNCIIRGKITTEQIEIEI